MLRRFAVVDVFTATPYLGNPVAVVLDGDGLDDAAMQRFARWTNLSETTFVLPPSSAEADWRLRIWTPGGELPFAGHPTLGSCHAWLHAGGRPRRGDEMVQECGIGRVRLRRQDGRLAFAAPALVHEAVDGATLAAVGEALGLAAPPRHAQWLDNGPRWLALVLDDAQAVLALEPDHARLAALGLKVGVAGAHAPGTTHAAFEVRAFAAAIGVPEDPVTGSLNAALAQWLIGAGLAPERYIAAQGTALGRAGRVHVERRDGEVWVGGDCAGCIEGRVAL